MKNYDKVQAMVVSILNRVRLPKLLVLLFLLFEWFLSQYIKIKIDSKTGWIIDADITQNLKGKVDLKDNPKVPGGMSAPIELLIVSKMTDK